MRGIMAHTAVAVMEAATEAEAAAAATVGLSGDAQRDGGGGETTGSGGPKHLHEHARRAKVSACVGAWGGMG